MSSSKRVVTKYDDSDDDDSIDFTSSGLSTRYSGSRSEQNKKAKRIAERNAFLDLAVQSGEEKLKQEARLHEIHKRNSAILSPSSLEQQEKENKKAVALDGGTSSLAVGCIDNINNDVTSSGPVQDVKATTCLGMRYTLRFSICMNGTEKKRIFPLWFTMEDVLKDFRTLLLLEQEKQQENSVVCETLLQYATTTPLACARYLRELRLCRQDKDTINRIDLSLLQWLFSLAVAPTLKEVDRNNISSKLEMCAGYDPIMLSAKQGAYQTLCELWSYQRGYPQQQRYLFSLTALSHQLRHWFGSTFPLEPAAEEKDGERDDTRSSNQQRILVSSSSRSTLTRFFHLWALALQNDLVRPFGKHQSTGGRIEDIQKTVSTAIRAILWAGLDPTFASNNSMLQDGHMYIHNILSILLTVVRKETCDESRYKMWIDDLVTQTFTTWTTKLGPGPRGTDALEDTHAWLCLSRTVRLIGHQESMKNIQGSEPYVLCSALQFALARYTLSCSFEAARNDDNDWLSQAASAILQRWDASREGSELGPWKTLAMAASALEKLKTSFPSDEPTKCYAIVEISTICFNLAVGELQHIVEAKISEAKCETKSPKAVVPEKKSLLLAFQFFEECTQRISKLTRDHLLQNRCFILSSTAVECMRNYSRLIKTRYATSGKHQSTIKSFFHN